jgi:hypothetical protein
LLQWITGRHRAGALCIAAHPGGSAVTCSSNKQGVAHQRIYTSQGDESVCAVQVTYSAILLDLLYLKWSGKENQMIGCMVSPEPAVRRTLPDSSPRSGGTASQRDSPQFRCGAATHLRRPPARLSLAHPAIPGSRPPRAPVHRATARPDRGRGLRTASPDFDKIGPHALFVSSIPQKSEWTVLPVTVRCTSIALGDPW